MKFAVFLSTLMFTCLSFAATGTEQVGIQMQVTVNEKIISQPSIATVVGENFMIEIGSDDGTQIKIDGEIYNCGDGTYTTHMNYAYKGEFASEPLKGHVSITSLKNEDAVITATTKTPTGENSISFKFKIVDPK